MFKPIRGTQLNRAHPLARGLIGAWLFNEGNGDSLFDVSVNNRNGVLINSPSWNATRDGFGVKLDGTSQYAQIPNGHQLTKFTHEVIYVPKTITNQSIMSIAETPGSSTGDRSMFIHSTNSKFGFYIFDGTQKFVYSTTTATDNNAYHIVVTSDGANIKMYVNGTLEGNTSAGSGYAGYATPELMFGLGYTNTGASNVSADGTLVLAHVYDDVLSASEITKLYLNPYGMFESPISPALLYAALATGIKHPIFGSDNINSAIFSGQIVR